MIRGLLHSGLLAFALGFFPVGLLAQDGRGSVQFTTVAERAGQGLSHTDLDGYQFLGSVTLPLGHAYAHDLAPGDGPTDHSRHNRCGKF